MKAFGPFLLGFLVCVGSVIRAQSPADRALADSLYVQAGAYAEAARLYQKLAKQWEKSGQLDSAFRNYFFEAKALSQLRQWEKALAICERLTHVDWLNHAGYRMGDVYFEKGYIEGNIGRLQEAISSYDLALSEEEKRSSPDTLKLADIRQFKGIALMYDGRPEEAEPLVLEAHEVRLEAWPPDTLALAYSANNLNILYSELYEYEKAASYIEEALRIIKLNLPQTHPHVAFLLNNYSTVRRSLGDPFGSRDALLEAIQYNEEAGRSYLLATNYYNLANLFTDLGELDQAATYFNKSYALGDTLFANPGEYRANLYDGLGRLAWYSEKYAEADSFFRLGLEQKQRLGNSDYIEEARSYHDLGLVAMDVKQWTEAATWFNQSIRLRSNKLGSDHPLTLESRSRLATCFWAQNKQKQAWSIWKECLFSYKRRDNPVENQVEVALRIAESYHKTRNPDSVSHYLKHAWTAMVASPQQISEWSELEHKKIGLISPLVFEVVAFHLNHLLTNSREPASAKRFITQEIIEQLNDFLPRMLPLLSFQHTRKNLSRTLQQIYAKAALIMHRGKKGDADDRLQFLLECVENSKAFSIRIALQNRAAIQFSGIPDSIVARDRNLRAQIWSGYAMREAEPDSQHNNMVQQHVRLQDEWNSWQKSLSVEYGAYYDLLYERPTVDLTQYGSMLVDRNETMLAYLSLDSILLALTFNGKEMKTYELKMADGWQDSIALFNSLITQRGELRRIGQLGYELYQQLIQPLEQDLGQKITLFPDGPLYMLNMGLLLSELPPSQPENASLSWLIRAYDIHYANQFASLNPNQTQPSYDLAIAPGFSTDLKATYLNHLPVDQQADSVFLNWLSTPWSVELAHQLAVQGWEHVLLEGEATQQRFMDLIGAARIIHVATHARVDNDRPLQSFLALNPDPQVSDDGYLFAHELYGMSMQNSLVVLSACQTGLGSYQQGEGVLSLAHAFQYAGCPSMIFSLWSIDDQQTNRLIKDFYTYLDRGNPISSALRSAQLDYLRRHDGELKHPYYWGSLVFMGENQIVSGSFLRKNLVAYLVGFLVVMLVAYVISQKIRKKIPVS